MLRIIVVENNETIEEGQTRKVKVVKGGKIVDKNVTVGVPKRMSHKKRMALMKAVRKSKTKKAMGKRKKSMKKRARLSANIKAMGAKIMSKRREKARSIKASMTYFGDSNFLLVNEDLHLTDLFGEKYDIKEGSLCEVYDDGYDIMLNVYEPGEGELEFEGIEVSPQKLYNIVREDLLEVVYEIEFDPEFETYFTEGEELLENKSPKINPADRKFLNKLLYDLTTPGGKTYYFDAIPLKDIDNILAKRNILLIDEEGSPWQGFITGRSGSDYFNIAYREVKNKEKLHLQIGNSSLALQWYKMPSGRYEINTYLT